MGARMSAIVSVWVVVMRRGKVRVTDLKSSNSKKEKSC